MNRRPLAIALALALIALLPGTVAAAPPVASDDVLTVAEDAAPTVVDVLADDADPDGDPLEITSVTNPAHGTVVVAVDGLSLTYEPDTNYNGPDTFGYTVTAGGESDSASVSVTVSAVNDAPVAANDPGGPNCDASSTGGSFLTPEDHAPLTLIQCFPLSNDTDIDGDELTIEIVDGPDHGTVSIVADTPGWITYDYDDDYGTRPGSVTGGTWTSDSFTYRAFDGEAYSEIATMRFWIAEINDEPSFTAGADVGVDEDSGAYSAAWATAISKGPPAESWQTVQFQVTNVSVAGGGALFAVAPTVSPSGTLTFTPLANTSGAADVTVRLRDSGGLDDYGINTPALFPDDTSDAVTFTISVGAENDPPVADNDSITVLEDAGATSVPVLTGDTDIDGDPLDITAVTQGAKGAVVITGGGTGLTYDPATNANGADSFTYTISDGNGGTDTATVTVTITPQNDAPTADDDAITLLEDAVATSVPVLVGDVDLEGDTLTITARTNGAKGSVVITGGGTGLTYRPGANTSGADSFTYTISDGNGGTDTATVAVTITPVQDDVPNAVNDSATIPTGPAAAIPVLANDTDLDGDPLTISATTNGAHGTVTITGGGTGLTYDPAPLFSGTDQFTYTVFDGFVTDTATVLVTVSPDTASPVVSGLKHSMPAQTLSGSSVRVKLQWGASDPGSGIANYHLQLSVNGGAYATVVLSSATATSYERLLTSNTTYQFRVRARDKSGNISGYSSFVSLDPFILQESTSLATYTGTWSTSINPNMSGGKDRFTTSSTRRVSFTFTGKGVGWVTTRTTSSGRAAVYLDGALVTTINLDAPAIGYKRMVYRATFASAGRHTLEIRPLGDGRVDIDAFAVLR